MAASSRSWALELACGCRRMKRFESEEKGGGAGVAVIYASLADGPRISLLAVVGFGVFVLVGEVCEQRHRQQSVLLGYIVHVTGIDGQVVLKDSSSIFSNVTFPDPSSETRAWSP